MSDLASILAIYQGSNGDATKALYDRLTALGPQGFVAVNLFRACKSSERAKVYRGGGYRGKAYERKQWSMDNLCKALTENASLGITWGWGVDEALKVSESPHHHVLYVEIPTGQVSFHNASRGAGPDYGKPWDGQKGVAATRICQWCSQLLMQVTENAA